MLHHSLRKRNIFTAISWVGKYFGMAGQNTVKSNAIFDRLFTAFVIDSFVKFAGGFTNHRAIYPDQIILVSFCEGVCPGKLLVDTLINLPEIVRVNFGQSF